MGWNVPRMITGINLSVLSAFVNVGVLAWFARRLWTEATASNNKATEPQRARCVSVACLSSNF
jgi:hypothetical protein